MEFCFFKFDGTVEHINVEDVSLMTVDNKEVSIYLQDGREVAYDLKEYRMILSNP